MQIPSGAKLVHTTIYDNSDLNPGNPDPGKEVRWGLQSWDEMLYGAFTFRWADETTAAPLPRESSRIRRSFGYLDKDFDGLLAAEELQRISRDSVADNPLFHESDSDGDAKLNEFELRNYQIAMARKRAEMREQEQLKRSLKPKQDPGGV